MRLWSYETDQEAIEECIGLSKGMTSKHDVFNTGFNGAKLVVNASNPNAVDKRKLMDATADALNQLDGTIYTGQDLNTAEDDMEYLQQHAPYVLAGLYSCVDTNVATGHGVFGSLQGVADKLNHTNEGVSGLTFLVHGVGKVGGTVARLLAMHGARVFTYDAFPQAADIPQCENVSHLRWQDIACDVFVPCSISGLVDESAAESLQCRCVCGASNLPFATDDAQDLVVQSRGITFIPESITSAGAVIVDSIEAFDRNSFLKSRPHQIYSFVRSLIREKASQILDEARLDPSLVPEAIQAVGEQSAMDTPAGLRFQPWMQNMTEEVDYLVIGGGIAGTHAALQLVKEDPNARCCLMQQRSQIVSHELRAHDLLYRKGVSAQQAVGHAETSECEDLWDELEKMTGKELRKMTGLIYFGHKSTVDSEAASCEQAGVGYQRYSREELQQRLHMHMDNDWEGIEEFEAGKIDGQAVQNAIRGLVEKSGVRMYDAETCEDLVPLDDGGVSVVTSHGRLIRAQQRVILAAGPHTNDTLALVGKQLDLRCRSVHYCSLDISGLDVNAPNASGSGVKPAPQWMCMLDDGETEFFGFSPSDEPNKVTVGLKSSSNADMNYKSMKHLRSQPDEQAQAKLSEFMQQRFGTKQPLRALHASSSMHTVTPDGQPVLGELPGVDSIVVFAGGWTTSFDQAPLLGKWLSDAAQAKPASEARAALSPSRSPSLAYTCTAIVPTS